jgi:hypothetical protein
MAAESDGAIGGRISGTVDVLVICGAAGVGKTSTACEVSLRLAGEGMTHAMVDCDELDRVHPWPVPGVPVWEMARRNLSAVWGNYAELGHHRLLLCGVFADLRQELRWIADAVPDAAFTVVRLTAGLGVLETRVRRREIGTAADDQLVRSTRQLEEIVLFDPPGTLVVDTNGLDVARVAERVLALWPAASLGPGRTPLGTA